MQVTRIPTLYLRAHWLATNLHAMLSRAIPVIDDILKVRLSFSKAATLSIRAIARR